MTTALKSIDWTITFPGIFSGQSKGNIAQALQRLQQFDVSARDEEVKKVDTQLYFPHLPDDLTQTLAQRMESVCNAIEKSPLEFKTEYSRYKTPSEGGTISRIRVPNADDVMLREWDQTTKIVTKRMNAVDLVQRAEAQFQFEVVIGDGRPKPRDWTVAKWYETLIHEVGVHVVQGLHFIEMWRQGKDWPELDAGEDSIDHILFRYNGYRRYNYWLNKLNQDEIDTVWPHLQVWDMMEDGSPNGETPSTEYPRDRAARAWIVALFRGTAVNGSPGYEYTPCLALARHFATQTSLPVKETANADLVDISQSQTSLDELIAQLSESFSVTDGQLVPKHRSFWWWGMTYDT